MVNPSACVPLWDVNGNVMVQRDETNMRSVRTTTIRYMKRFMSEGFYSDLRGKLQGRKIPNSARFGMVSGGTITTAMIWAREGDENNAWVKRVGEDR